MIGLENDIHPALLLQPEQALLNYLDRACCCPMPACYHHLGFALNAALVDDLRCHLR